MLKKNQKKLIVTILWVSLFVLALSSVHLYSLLYSPAKTTAEQVLFLVPNGANFSQVATSLQKQGIIKNKAGFNLAASIKKSHTKLKAGEFELSAKMSPVEILSILVAGRSRDYSITIPEGYSLRDIARTLKEAGLLNDNQTEELFLKRATDSAFLASLGFGSDTSTLEGYLFPDTYRFSKQMTIEGILKKMFARFNQVYDKEFAEIISTKGLEKEEVIILASIIQKEAAKASELPLVSSVFHNRINIGIRLQSCPTVIYGILDQGQEFDGNLTKKHLQTRTNYNTYKFGGLPPGPISNPGKAAIRAAIFPAEEKYLYFVSKNNGTHKFSKNLKEHNRAVRKYQLQ